MLKIITTENRIVDQFAQQTHLENYIPDGVDILWLNLDGCTHNMFEWEYDKGMFKWYNFDNVYVFIDCTKECSELAEIIEKYKEVVKRYNINEDHVYWVTGNPNDKKYVKHHIYWEMFLTAIKEMIPDRDEVLLSSRGLIIDPDRTRESHPQKKFLCWNGRNRKWRREIYDKIKDKRVYTTPKTWKKGLLLEEFSYKFLHDDDYNACGDGGIENGYFFWNQFDDVSYQHEFWLVTETVNYAADKYYGHVFLTEKTFKPIILKMGFLIAGCKGSLKKLRNLGFKTFSDYWDESYDTLDSKGARRNALTETIKYIILNDVHVPDEILEYNYNVLKEHNADQELKDTISNLTPI